MSSAQLGESYYTIWKLFKSKSYRTKFDDAANPKVRSPDVAATATRFNNQDWTKMFLQSLKSTLHEFKVSYFVLGGRFEFLHQVLSFVYSFHTWRTEES